MKRLLIVLILIDVILLCGCSIEMKYNPQSKVESTLSVEETTTRTQVTTTTVSTTTTTGSISSTTLPPTTIIPTTTTVGPTIPTTTHTTATTSGASTTTIASVRPEQPKTTLFNIGDTPTDKELEVTLYSVNGNQLNPDNIYYLDEKTESMVIGIKIQNKVSVPFEINFDPISRIGASTTFSMATNTITIQPQQQQIVYTNSIPTPFKGVTLSDELSIPIKITGIIDGQRGVTTKKTLKFKYQKDYGAGAVGVRLWPKNFNLEEPVEMRWKTDIFEYGTNPDFNKGFRFCYDGVSLHGDSGYTGISTQMQSWVKTSEEAGCEYVTPTPKTGPQIIFAFIDGGLTDSDPNNDNMGGLAQDGDPDAFPRFRRIYSDGDKYGAVGVNIATNDPIPLTNPTTIEWIIKRGDIVVNPTENLHKELYVGTPCSWNPLLPGTYRQWHLSVIINGITYNVGTYYLLEKFANHISTYGPFTMFQENFGSCYKSMDYNPIHIEYYDFRVYSSDGTMKKITEWSIGDRGSHPCEYNDERYGVDVIERNGQKRILLKYGHESDINLKREPGTVLTID